MGNYTSCIDYNRISKSENNLYSFSSWAGVAYGNNGVSVLSSVRQNLEYAGQEHDNCFNESIKFVADIESKTTEVTNELSNLSDCLLETAKAFEKAEDKIGNMVTKESALLALLDKLDTIYGRNKNNSLTKNINPGDNISFNSENFKKNASDKIKEEIENKIKEANAAAASAATSTLDIDDESAKTGALPVSDFSTIIGLPGIEVLMATAYLNKLKLPQGPRTEAGYHDALVAKIKEKYPKIDDKTAGSIADTYIKSQKSKPLKTDTPTDTTQDTNKGDATKEVASAAGTAAATAITGGSNSTQQGASSNPGGNQNTGGSTNSPPNIQDKVVAEVKPGGELPSDGTADIGAELKPVIPKPEPKPDVPKPDNKPQPLPDNKPDTNTPQPLPDNKPDNGGTGTDSNQTPNTNNTTPNTSTNTNTGGGNTYRPTTNTGGNSNANSGVVTPPAQEPTTTTPSTPDSNTGSANGVGDSLDVISIDKETPKTTGTTTKSSGGSNVIPIGLGVAAAGAAAVAGARFIKNRSNKEESDENYEEEGNSFSYLGDYQDDGKYEENVSTGSNLYEETMDTPSTSKYKAGSVNKLVLDNGADVKIQSDDIINQKEELE